MSLQVHFNRICKDFGPVRVLHDVDFALDPGRVYGLLGENGAGKSTLMKILAGYETATEGALVIDGKPQQFADSRAAESAGIVLIHQEFNLAEDLTVTENIFLGRELRHGVFLDDAAMTAQARVVLDQVGLNIDPATKARNLIVAEKQLVEVAKALSRNARLLIMDEPTATLTPNEAQRLFTLIETLRRRGVTILYISHKLDEVQRITSEVVVMRDGRYVTRERTDSLTRQQMATLMVGRELSDMFPPKLVAPEAPPLFKVQGVTVPGWAYDVSFEVRPGEILGFAGLVGAGRTELFEGLLGLRERSGGAVELGGKKVAFRHPRDAAGEGLTYLSEDRKGKGLHVTMSLQENLTLMDLGRHARPWLDPKSERAALDRAVADFGIRSGDVTVKVAQLSGGNQQKLAIAKVLQPKPRVVVLDEPTRGVDVGAKHDIYVLIQKLAAQGCGVIVVSSELIELIGLCHRVLVMRGGHSQGVLDTDKLTEETLIAYATGTH